MRAQPATEARQLFDQARALLEQGDTREACRLFARSQKLERAAGTMLNLGECAERAGELARAWAWFDEAALEYERSGKPGPAAFARSRAEALAPKLGVVTLRIAEPGVEGLSVKLAGRTVEPAAEITRRVEPGTVRIVVRAPGRKPFETTVTAAVGDLAAVEVPALALEAPAPANGKGDAAPEAASPARGWKIALGTSLGVGVVGGILWFHGLRQIELAEKALCSGRYAEPGCTPPVSRTERERLNEQGDRGQSISFGGAAILSVSSIVALVSLYKVLTAGPAARTTSSVSAPARGRTPVTFSPIASPELLGISIAGGF